MDPEHTINPDDPRCLLVGRIAVRKSLLAPQLLKRSLYAEGQRGERAIRQHQR
jgi:hypothetical protein